MTAYMVLTHKIVDLKRYVDEYVPLVIPLLERHGIEVVAAELNGDALEGGATSAIVFRGASKDAFRALYEDPDYADPKALRHSLTTDRNMVIAPELASPR
jgi:uncharacterized protein (DUF1330 family)